MPDPKTMTSTFTIQHNRCDPAKWTAHDILAFAAFIDHGDMQNAARLARLGMQLVLSEHHVPKGGELEPIGWATTGDQFQTYDDLGEAVDAGGDNDITELHRIYRGPAQHVVKFGIGDGDGNLDGHEYEIKPSAADAEAFLKSLKEH
jgi:hypothetical protein